MWPTGCRWAGRRLANGLATFWTASKAMRQILISYAERAATAKRGGDVVHVTLSELALDSGNTLEDLLVINALLEKLEN